VQGRRVVLVVDVPELPFLPRDCVSRPFARATNCAVPRNVVERRQRGLRRVVARLKEDLPAIEIFDPLPTLCSKGDCVPVRDGEALYQDSHHLSGRGSRLVARALLQELGEMRVSTW
jgi:hypothetical protein